MNGSQYPNLVGEPNFVLISISAVFGFFLIIFVYFIVKTNYSKKHKDKNYNINNSINNSTNSNKNTTKNNNYSLLTNQNIISIPTIASDSTVSKSNINQVFNIKENIYTLDDAPAVCGALGANVASLNQLIDAHKNGADWCNVGWTKDGLAAYPIQYSTWKTLQDNDPNKRNICGKPGINLSRNDPNLLYGVNCYGIKPEPKGNEKVKQQIISDTQAAINEKIARFQKNMNNIGVAPFNVDKWSA